MDKIAIIQQPAGLGDILFTSKIREKLKNEGYKVFHPVIKEYSWISDYVEGNFPVLDDFIYKNIMGGNNLRPLTKKIGNIEIFLVPLHTADRLFEGSVMDAKYKLMSINIDDWSDYLVYSRNEKKENDLINKLNIKQGEDFIIINNKFGSPPNFVTKEIKIESDCRIINLEFYEGFSLFDWIKVLEMAKEIHVVESSINYLLEKENISSDKIFIYSKHNPPSFDHVKHLFSKNWNYIF